MGRFIIDSLFVRAGPLLIPGSVLSTMLIGYFLGKGDTEGSRMRLPSHCTNRYCRARETNPVRLIAPNFERMLRT